MTHDPAEHMLCRLFILLRARLQLRFRGGDRPLARRPPLGAIF
jgi:hypothetical protein